MEDIYSEIEILVEQNQPKAALAKVADWAESRRDHTLWQDTQNYINAMRPSLSGIIDSSRQTLSKLIKAAGEKLSPKARLDDKYQDLAEKYLADGNLEEAANFFDRANMHPEAAEVYMQHYTETNEKSSMERAASILINKRIDYEKGMMLLVDNATDLSGYISLFTTMNRWPYATNKEEAQRVNEIVIKKFYEKFQNDEISLSHFRDFFGNYCIQYILDSTDQEILEIGIQAIEHIKHNPHLRDYEKDTLEDNQVRLGAKLNNEFLHAAKYFELRARQSTHSHYSQDYYGKDAVDYFALAGDNKNAIRVGREFLKPSSRISQLKGLSIMEDPKDFVGDYREAEQPLNYAVDLINFTC